MAGGSAAGAFATAGAGSPDPDLMERVMDRLAHQTPLRVMTCLQIAAKMLSHSKVGLCLSCHRLLASNAWQTQFAFVRD